VSHRGGARVSFDTDQFPNLFQLQIVMNKMLSSIELCNKTEKYLENKSAVPVLYRLTSSSGLIFFLIKLTKRTEEMKPKFGSTLNLVY